MDSTPRSGSKDLPPHLAELMDKLKKPAASFIREFDRSEQRMRQIVGRFQKIPAEVEQMQEQTDAVRTTGVFTGGVGLGLVLIAPFTGGVGFLAGAAAAAGTATVVGTNLLKTVEENQSAEEVLNLGKEFLRIVEPLQNELEEIKRTCERLEEETAAVQAEKTLSDMEDFQRILRRVAELNAESVGALAVAGKGRELISDLLLLLVKDFTVTGFTKENRQFRASILLSADQCQKVSEEFQKMKSELSEFSIE